VWHNTSFFGEQSLLVVQRWKTNVERTIAMLRLVYCLGAAGNCLAANSNLVYNLLCMARWKSCEAQHIAFYPISWDPQKIGTQLD
jgi:hypothetical protein